MEELSGPVLSFFAVTVIKPDFMDTIDVDDNKVVTSSSCWVGTRFAESMA
jgi:hypothetical protein